jgi:hypothetical protein
MGEDEGEGETPPTHGGEEALHSLGVLDLEIVEAFKELRPSAHPQKSEG